MHSWNKRIGVHRMNLERLNIIAEWLEAGAPHKNGYGFNMNTWYSTDETDYANNECGTVMCIGGAAQQFFGGPSSFKSDYDEDIMSAGELLGLDYDTAHSLFYPPDDKNYYDPTSYYCKGPKEVAEVVRHLMETGEVDWALTDE